MFEIRHVARDWFWLNWAGENNHFFFGSGRLNKLWHILASPCSRISVPFGIDRTAEINSHCLLALELEVQGALEVPGVAYMHKTLS